MKKTKKKKKKKTKAKKLMPLISVRAKTPDYSAAGMDDFASDPFLSGPDIGGLGIGDGMGDGIGEGCESPDDEDEWTFIRDPNGM